MKLKQVFLAVIISSAPFNSQAWWIAFGPLGIEESSGTMKCAVDLSTGTFVRKAVSGDCYQFDYVNPNGTTAPAAGRYTACPTQK